MASQDKVSSNRVEEKMAPIVYPLFDDISCYADCSNSHQKVRLIGESLGGFVVVPKGCSDLMPPDAKVAPLELSGSERGLLALLRMEKELRKLAGGLCLAVSNEVTLFEVIFLAVAGKLPIVMFCWDPPGVTVRDKKDAISRFRCWVLDLLLEWAVRLTRGLILNLHPGFLDGRIGKKTQEKIFAFPNGTTYSKNRLFADSGRKIPKRFVVACRVNEHKGCREIVEFFRKLHAEDKETSLVWIGGGDVDCVLRKLLADGVNPDKLIMMGSVPRDEALKYIATASFGLNIYSDKPSLRWNYVLKAPEFLSFGIPIVTNRLPGICEYAIDGKTGIVFDSGDIDMGVRKTLTVLRDSCVYKCMCENALENAKRYDWDEINAKMADKILQLFSDIGQ